MRIKTLLPALAVAALFSMPDVGFAQDMDEVREAITRVKEADPGIASYFDSAAGYAVFPGVGKAGLGIGGARGSGLVFRGGSVIGKVTLSQISIGFQAGGTGFSQVIFFQDKRALDEFTSGNFEFGAEAQATAITAAAGASANTAGNSTTASAGKNNASTTGGRYNKGMATFTITKGGLMFEASIGGQ